MSSSRHHRSQVHDLAESLVMEYSGALPAGQVFAAVFRADRAVRAFWGLTPPQRLTTCEEIARRQLTLRIGSISTARSPSLTS